MKIDETQDLFALYSTRYSMHTAHIVALFDSEEEARAYIRLCDYPQKLFVKRVSFSQLIRSYELWLNIERRYA